VPARFGILLLGLAFSAGAINISHAAGAYAIGRGPGSSWGGGGRDAANYEDAGRDALQHCAQHGPNCLIVTYFSRKCFSLAIPPGTGSYYWATRDTMAEAREAVMDHCLASGRSCEVKVAFCDARGLVAAAMPLIPQPAPIPTPQLPRAEERLPAGGSLYSAPIDWNPILLLAIGFVVVIGVAAALRKQSFRMESDFFGSRENAEHYDNEAARFRAMSRKLDAETELADSFIKAKRTRAELDDIEEMFRD
jgi:Domain of unknown function (DUF4189)